MHSKLTGKNTILTVFIILLSNVGSYLSRLCEVSVAGYDLTRRVRGKMAVAIDRLSRSCKGSRQQKSKKWMDKVDSVT